MPDNLAEKEFHLIQEISRSSNQTQRTLSQSSGMSLGMTNLLLKKLARKGLVKVRQLNWNKVQYLLTPKGMLEKTRKSFLHAAWTLRHLRTLVVRIQEILQEEYRSGRREFCIVAQAEAAELVDMALREIPLTGVRVHRLSALSEVPRGTDAVFIVSPEIPRQDGVRFISLVDEKGSAKAQNIFS